MAYITWLDENTPRRRAKVNYEIKTIDGSRKRASKTFKPKTPMKTILSFKREVEEEFERSEGVINSKITFRQYADEFLKVYNDTLSPSTQRTIRTTIYSNPNGLTCSFGNILLRDIKLSHVQMYLNKLVDAGLSTKTIKNRIMVLNNMLEKACKMSYLDWNYRNPCKDVRYPREKVEKKVESYNYTELMKLIELAKEYNNKHLLLEIYISAFSGMRRSEMAALRWCNVDMDKRIIHVVEARVRGPKGDVTKPTKTKSGTRDIPMPEILYSVLKSTRKEYQTNKLKYGEDFVDSGYVFCDEYGRNFTSSSLTGRWTRFSNYVEKRGLPKKNLHSLRHFFSSYLVSQGVDIRSLMELMGHAEISTTLQIYTNSFMEKKIEAVKKFDDVFKIEA